ncbi:MAG TPA: hypothetical protein VHN15_00935 [Thermoanaerobaculia bacterium]|nr:hypothetical protein [Thermoanaerobaculia bacterium]
MTSLPDYERSVFVNCPFDLQYRPLFEAITFAVFDCGFRARCALEVEDSSVPRLEKIFNIITECRFGITDLSRTEVDGRTQLPRFNMPLELGIFLGARRYGQGEQARKACLVMDREKDRYRTFISDLAGQDVRIHGDRPKEAIAVVRDWLRSVSQRPGIPGGREISDRYAVFRRELPTLRRNLNLSRGKLIFVDYAWLVSEWLKLNA